MNTPRRLLRGPSTTLGVITLVAMALAACESSGSTSGGSVVDDAALSAYLQSVTDEVAGESTYRVIVYDADFAQAFALPGNEIALTLGMLTFIHNEAELACVLGHEIAHHRLGDVTDFFGTEASPPIDASHPLAQGWPEAQEHAADDLGLTLCAAAGYEPLCAAHLMFRAAGWDSDESVDELLDGASTRPLVSRTLRAVDTIGAEGLEGGLTGFREYIAIFESLPMDDLATDGPRSEGALPFFQDIVDIGEELSRMVEEEYDAFLRDALEATNDWRDRECAREGVTVVPSNHLDAFGHCWSGCQVNEVCSGACGNPGIFYEIARSAGWRGEHDSFWEDTRNQEIGNRGAFTDQSCVDYCTDKIESGGLDLTAPRRRWYDCESGTLLDVGHRPPGGSYSDYGALGSPDIFGDPHLVTMDGLRYDFHGVGEFIAMTSTVDDLVVQVRLTEVAALQMSKTTAVAANVNGDRVGAYLGPGAFVVRVNGEPTPPTGSWVPLPNGGSVQVDHDEVVFQWPDDTRLWVYYWSDVLDVAMTLPSQRKAALAGLLGNGDGDPTNEHITRDGVPVDVPDEHGEARKQALYAEFGDSWRIGAEESLFDYEPGESTDDFQAPGFPTEDRSIDDLNEAIRREAREDCISLGVTESPWLEDCIFDIGFTGEISWANSARNAADPNSLTWNEMYETQSEIDGEGVYELEQFLATAGDEQFFRFVQTMSSLDLANWEVIAPSGDRVFHRCVFACNQPGAHVLPESGLYTSRVVADPEHNGVLKVARNVVPEPQIFDAGAATAVSLESLGDGAGLISVPGDEDVYRIDGSVGTTVTLRAIEIDGRLFFGHWKLTDPVGTVLFDQMLPTSGGTPRSEDLTLDGTYLLAIHGGESWPSQGDYGYGNYSILLQVAPTPP
jgi:hypothetical protein